MTLRTWRAARKFNLPARTSNDVRVDRQVRVPMRDGVILLGDRYYSASKPDQPVILIRSPYGRFAGFGMTARLFAERGFQVFLQSCRGTFGSGGQFAAMPQEPDDGMDTLDWLQCQPWCHGKVYTFGMSYLGMVQWAIAAQAGERLGAMTLHCTLSNYRNEALSFDGHALEGVLGWATMMAKLTSSKSTFALILAMLNKVKPEVYSQLPLRDLDQMVVGRKVPWWKDWMDHGDPADPWWDAIDFTRTIPAIAAPATMIGGWHDLFLPWQVKDFELMQAAGREAWLTIGPWHHIAQEGGGEALRQGLELFRAMSSGDQPFRERDRVRLYVQGAGEWRDYSAWPPKEARETRLHLRAEGTLTPEPEGGECEPSRFTYDPADPTPSLHTLSPFRGNSKKPDMRRLEARDDALVFTGAPLDADADVVGPVAVDLHIRSSSAHTDLYACLCDVDPSGLSLKVCDGYVRLRADKHPPDANGVREVKVECWPTAYRFRRGHRLRVIVASGAHPRWARNLGTGEPLGEGTTMVRQAQEIFHDASRASSLRVQIC